MKDTGLRKGTEVTNWGKILGNYMFGKVLDHVKNSQNSTIKNNPM